MNQKIKISQLPAKGSNLAAQDLIEIAEFTGTGYISKSITGQEIIDAAVGNVDWGDIGGTLSAQTDLQNALDAKVPTSRTLTINGVTQDLSANRTFTISTGITIGSTAIASGVVGRVLFEGAGNVVQESSSLFWDDTNARLGIGTSTFWGSVQQLIVGSATEGRLGVSNTGRQGVYLGRVSNVSQIFAYDYASVAALPLALNSFGGNVLIGTTTDAGFKLDVNGTARVQGSLTIPSTSNFGISIIRISASGIAEQIYNSGGATYLGADNSAGGFLFTGGLPFASFFGSGGNTATQFGTNSATRMTIFAGGNVGINTTTDAGYRLDVNGTARVSSLTIPNFSTITSGSNSITYETFRTLFGAAFQTINNQYAFNFDDGGGNSTLTSGTTGRFQLSSRFAPTSGTAVYNTFLLNAVINQTGGANGITRGLYINPTLTAAADFRAIETARGNVVFGNLPTSSAGLPTGAIWNDAGTLKIV